MNRLEYKKLVEMWLKHKPVNAYTLQRMTFEDFLISLSVPGSLPSRHSSDIEPLVKLLTKVIFHENRLSIPLGNDIFFHGGEVHSQLNGQQTVISDRELAEFCSDYKTRYGYKDWTDALETTLVRAGCPKHMIVFGQKYRVGFEWPNGKEEHGVFINVQPELLEQCRYRNLQSEGKATEIIK